MVRLGRASVIRLLFSTTAWCATIGLSWAAGPFGIEKGTPIEELEVQRLGTHAAYDLVTVPDPDPMFVQYAVRAPDGYGVCTIKAMTHAYQVVDGDASVDGPRDLLLQHLWATYGAPTFRIDESLRGATRYNPELSIIEHNYKPAVMWDSGANAPGTQTSGDPRPFPDSVSSVMLETITLDGSEFAFFVTFWFDFPGCHQAAFNQLAPETARSDRSFELEANAALSPLLGCWRRDESGEPPDLDGFDDYFELCFLPDGSASTLSAGGGDMYGVEGLGDAGAYEVQGKNTSFWTKDFRHMDLRQPFGLHVRRKSVE
jgi:hypothetical protein